MSPIRTSNCRRMAGFTIMEAALSVGIVGVLMVASTATFSAIARSRQSQTEGRLAYLLGQQLMAEIMQCYFQQPTSTPNIIVALLGPILGTTRSQYNYVDAYNGYIASPPVSRSGTALSGYSNWSESVIVNFANPSSPATTATSSTLKMITVTVTAPTGKQYTLNGFRSFYGAYELVPSVQTNYITGVPVSLQGPSPTTTVNTGAHPLNITTSQ